MKRNFFGEIYVVDGSGPFYNQNNENTVKMLKTERN